MNPKHEPTFKEYYFNGILTPVLLPTHYQLDGLEGNRIKYRDANGQEKLSDPYMHHDEDKIIVDEFRKQFPHDSIIVILISPQNNLFLQRRGQTMRWEPGKIDLASVAAQRRAELVEDHYEKVDNNKLALNKIAEETGVSKEELKEENLMKLGQHFNPTTNEYQTLYAYKLENSLSDLNQNLEKIEGDKAEEWFEQPYRTTIQEYFGDEIEKYAGGEHLRPINFISNEEIKAKLDEATAPPTA